jgi:hypothetical protein
VSVSPEVLDYAVGVASAGTSVFVANSEIEGYTSCFMEYDVPNDSWYSRSVPAYKFKNAVAMAYDPEGYQLYTLLGGSGADHDRDYFFRYSPPERRWYQMPSTAPVSIDGQGAGDALVWVPRLVWGETGRGYLYAFIGDHFKGSSFARFDLEDESWEQVAFPPHWDIQATDDGASLVWCGDCYLYALQGEVEEHDPNYNFARYDLLEDEWIPLRDIPASPHSGGSGGVGDGASLLWAGGSLKDYIFALSGNQAAPEPIWDRRFYCYHIPGNTWEMMEDFLPGGVGEQNGPRLAFANDSIFCWRGCNGDPSLFRNTFGHHVLGTITLNTQSFRPGDLAILSMHFANAGEGNVKVDIRVYVELPPNQREITIGGKSNILLPAGRRMDLDRIQGIPSNAPSGAYSAVLTIKDSLTHYLLSESTYLYTIE